MAWAASRMVACVECYIDEVGAPEAVKLEEAMTSSEDGPRIPSSYTPEDRFAWLSAR